MTGRGAGRVGRRVFTLLVETRCNSYCLFCGQREVDEALTRTRARLGLLTPETHFGAARGRYTLDTARAALELARAEGYDELSLQGGEPTLFDPLPELVAAARGLGFAHVGLVTNGRRLRERDFTARLLAAGLDGITVSLVGADAELHDMVSAAPGAFAQLAAGMAHVRAIVPALARPVTVNCNLIVSRATLPRLDDAVRLAAELGAQAIALHLTRWAGLGAEPGVRERLGFSLADLAPQVARAVQAAEQAGVRLHLTDVPACLHPRLSAEEAALLAARARVSQHHYRAAAYEFEIGPHELAEPRACATCLLAKVCPKVPREYLVPPDEAAERALSPLDGPALAARADAELAALDPAAADAPDRVSRLAGALAALEALSSVPGALAAPRARVAEAAGDLMMLAAQRKDGRSMVAALCARLGLHPPRTFDADAWTWNLLRLDEDELAQASGAARDAPGMRLRLGPFAIALEGRRDGDAVELTRATPLLSAAATPHQRVMRALFLGILAPPVQRARRLRLSPRGLEVDEGQGFALAWAARDPDAVSLDE